MGKNRIKVHSLVFGETPFRKLANLPIDFADRFTLIAGHNGIGKSTILGLVSNTFGLSSSSSKSYFDEPFYANIERIVYLDLKEVEQQSPSVAPVVTADINGKLLRKRCSLTVRSEYKRARVVPRTVDPQKDDPVGPDAKVPLPTIYLGIKRLAPIGEAEEKEVLSRSLLMEEEDRQLILNFIKEVIVGTKTTNNVTSLSIRGSRKKTAQPGYELHDAQAVSLGQDSLASIATALASFNRLKREMGEDYPGGLLVIDELDAGFHPHAISRLVEQLKKRARQLDLQVVATTHSPRLIEAVHPDGDGNARAPDKVIYLVDTARPYLAKDQSLRAILNDMALKVDDSDLTEKPTLCVYFEDEEAEQFFDVLCPNARRGRIGREAEVKIRLIPLGVGGAQLLKLPDADGIFADRVLVVDADTMISKKARERGNVVKLPCTPGAAGTARSPENSIRLFLHELAEAKEGPLRDALMSLRMRNPSTDQIRHLFLSDGQADSDNREKTKLWWKRHWPNLRRIGVISSWAALHPEVVQQFLSEFEAAVQATAARIRAV